MTFAHPEILLLLFLLPGVLLDRTARPLFQRIYNRASRALLFSSAQTLAGLQRKTGSLKLFLLNVLRALCFIFLILALARPQKGISFVESDDSGRDLALALDVSGSMNALDFSLNGQAATRLEALKAVSKEFIKARAGDRLCLVVFGSEVSTLSPLTSDTESLLAFLDTLQIGMVGEGTALGDGLGIALKRVREIPAQSKAIVLVSDGAKTAGGSEPRQIAALAAKDGVKIYTIGIGSDQLAPFKVRNIFGGESIDYRRFDFDEATLKDLAQQSGGKYFTARDTQGLRDIYTEISQLETRDVKSYEHVQYEELYLPLLLLGLLCFLLQEALKIWRYLLIP